MADKKEELTEQELQQKLQEVGQKKQQEFLNEIEQVSKKYGLTLVAVPGINQEGRVIAQIQLTVRQNQQ